MSQLRRVAAVGLLATTMLVRASAPPEDLSERRQPMAGFQGTRLATVEPSSYDATARTVEAVLSAGSAVRRWYFTEELEISEQAVDLGRAESGLVCLLDTHNQREADAVIGRVSDVRIENGSLIGALHFGETDRARQIEGMVARGELRGVSIGYRVTKWEITRTDETEHETWRATAWELLEVSLVSVPADANAGVRSAPTDVPGSATLEEEEDMRRNLPSGAAAPIVPPAAAPAVEHRQAPAAQPAPAIAISRFGPSEALGFVADARSFGEPVATRAMELVAQNERGEISAETARSALLTAAAEHQRAATGGSLGGPRAEVIRDEQETTRGLIVGALVSRAMGRAPQDGERQYMGYSILDLARARANVSTSERDADIIMRAAHTTSDFPLIMEQTGQRILLERYQAAAPTFTAIARRRNLRDFRPTSLLRVGDFPTLKPYLEDGEIKAGTIGEGKEQVQLGSFGRRLTLTRQAIVNDDIGAFDDVFGSIGTMIAQFENAFFYTVKAANGGLGPKLADGKTLFHADHGNLAPSGTSLSIPGLSAGRAAIRKHKNIEGQVMNLAPRQVLVGPDVETLAEQLISPLQPQQANNVNPFSGRLDPVVEGSIDDYAWELYADPAQAPVWVFGSLESSPAPRLMTQESWSTDGVGFRVTYDFYADAIDYRGAYRNPGAAPA